MPDTTSPTPFDLTGLEDIVRNASPELAKEVDSVEVSEPEISPQPGEVLSDPEPVSDTIKDAEPEPEPETSDTSIADELAELNRQSAAPKAPPVVAPAAEVKPAAASPRDSDLSLDSRQSAVLHPKTKKIIEERNQKIIAERNKYESLSKEKEALTSELNQARESLKKGTIPKEVEAELTALREAIREIDIERDPTLHSKYAAKISSNSGKILEILKSFGVGRNDDGSDNLEAIRKLEREGINFKTVTPYVKKLSDEGYEEDAEQLRDILRDNLRIKNAKESEISEWRTNFSVKKEQSAADQKQHMDRGLSEAREHSQRILNSDIATLSKDFPMLQRPADPLPTDSAAVVKSKQDSIAAYDVMRQQVSDAITQLDASKVSPDKASEVTGRLSANAVQSIVLKQHVLPKLIRDMADLRARNTELESKFGKIRTAGSLSRAHAAAASSPAGARAPLPESNEDAAKQIAKEMGLSID